MLVTTAGGMAGVDRFAVEIAVGRDADLVVGTAAAEKVYRSTGPATEVAVTLALAAGTRLTWLPQETILFDGARLARRIDVATEEGASLVLAEAMVLGRSAMGVRVAAGAPTARWPLRDRGPLAFAS